MNTREEQISHDAKRHRERIVDLQQWCAQYPELESLGLALARTRYEFEKVSKLPTTTESK